MGGKWGLGIPARGGRESGDRRLLRQQQQWLLLVVRRHALTTLVLLPLSPPPLLLTLLLPKLSLPVGEVPVADTCSNHPIRLMGTLLLLQHCQ